MKERSFGKKCRTISLENKKVNANYFSLYLVIWEEKFSIYHDTFWFKLDKTREEDYSTFDGIVYRELKGTN